MSLCGLRSKIPPSAKVLRPRRPQKPLISRPVVVEYESHGPIDVKRSHERELAKDDDDDNERSKLLIRRKSADFEWARADQLSVISEEQSRRNTQIWENDDSWEKRLDKGKASRVTTTTYPIVKKTRFSEQESIPEDWPLKVEERTMPVDKTPVAPSPRSIDPPPRDVCTLL